MPARHHPHAWHPGRYRNRSFTCPVGQPPSGGTIAAMNATEIFYTGLLFLMLGLAGAFGLYVLWRLKG